LGAAAPFAFLIIASARQKQTRINSRGSRRTAKAGDKRRQNEKKKELRRNQKRSTVRA
jgi:hypothetical protein